MKITLARGDSYERGLVVKDATTKQTVTTPWDEIYFTVKTDFKNKDFVLQKTLTGGGIVNDGDGHYTLFLHPEDTDNLRFVEYDFDFEFKKDDFTRTFPGRLEITKEVTHRNNE